MTLEPLLNAPLAVQFHVYTVVPAAVIGAYILLNRKGTPLHKLLGRIWIGLMVATAASTFFIHVIDVFYGFSPIHFLSAYVIFGSFRAVYEARRGNIVAHRKYVTNIYLGGIVLAGLFTLIPGRIMNQIVLNSFDFRDFTDIRMIGWGLAFLAGLFFLAKNARSNRHHPLLDRQRTE